MQGCVTVWPRCAGLRLPAPGGSDASWAYAWLRPWRFRPPSADAAGRAPRVGVQTDAARARERSVAAFFVPTPRARPAGGRSGPGASAAVADAAQEGLRLAGARRSSPRRWRPRRASSSFSSPCSSSSPRSPVPGPAALGERLGGFARF